MPSQVLVEVDYPIYSVAVTPEGYAVLGGGGGNSKTGVPNVLEMHRLDEPFSTVTRVETGAHAVMNIAVHPAEPALVVGLDELGRMYTYNTDGVGPGQKSETVFSTGKEQQTDFGNEGGYQKVVRFDHAGERFVTGGADGVLRLWRYPTFEMIREIKASADLELKDACFSLDDTLVASISTRSRDLSVWNAESGDNVKTLQFKGPGGEYQFNACRFVAINDGQFLLALATMPRHPAYLVLWETTTWSVVNKRVADKGPCTCMDVSPGGTFAAAGTADGNVAIFEIASFKKLHVAQNVHPLFITCLAWAPGSTAVLSVSVDRRCVRTDVVFTENEMDLKTMARGALRVVLFAILAYWLLKTFLGPKYGLH